MVFYVASASVSVSTWEAFQNYPVWQSRPVPLLRPLMVTDPTMTLAVSMKVNGFRHSNHRTSSLVHPMMPLQPVRKVLDFQRQCQNEGE